ncbi:MAG TPA: type II secretion system minor pseudopilin GspJ [Gammaproteobacteria bacterium]
MTRARGFTLIELLVALTIFALLSLLAYGGLDSVLNASEHTRARAQRLGELQRAMTRLADDFSQLAPRPVRDGFGDPEPALLATSAAEPPLAFSRAGWPNPAGQPRSTLQRVAYRLEERALLRQSWNVLDRAPESRVQVQRLLEQVDGLLLRFRDDQGQWSSDWPPAGEARESASLPVAIEVVLDVEGFGRITRLVATRG